MQVLPDLFLSYLCSCGSRESLRPFVLLLPRSPWIQPESGVAQHDEYVGLRALVHASVRLWLGRELGSGLIGVDLRSCGEVHEQQSLLRWEFGSEAGTNRLHNLLTAVLSTTPASLERRFFPLRYQAHQSATLNSRHVPQYISRSFG